MTTARTRLLGLALAAALAPGLPGCGGGGGGASSPPPPSNAPHSLAYPVPAAVYATSTAIAPNVPTHGGGAVDTWSISPALPAGLTFDAATGTIAGTPTAPVPAGFHTVTATNADGQGTTQLSIAVDLSAQDSLAAKASFSDDDLRYFLGRTHFGAKASDVTAVQAVGLPAYVDQMLTFADTTALEQAAHGQLLTTDPTTSTTTDKFPSHAQVARYWLHLMVTTPQPFQEVLAFFWHDHFASSTAALETTATWWMPTQINLWRTQGAGNLRTLLLAMARDWIMLEFLDGVRSTKTAPNENFAREWFELFTLGVDNGYTQADILQAAKAFTGYRTRFNAGGWQEVAFDTSRHDATAKTLFGVTIPGQNVTDDYAAVVNATVDQRPVAEFICRKLFEHFCYEQAGDLPIAAMAAKLRADGYELAPLLRTLFKSEAFFSARSKAGLVKGPIEHVVGFIRATNLAPIDAPQVGDAVGTPANTFRTLDTWVTTLAQRPSQPPSVNGWPVTEQWLSAQNMLDRANTVVQCIRDRTDQTNAGVDVTTLLPPPGQRSAPEVVDALATLLRVTLSASERTQCIDYLNSQAGAGGVPTPSPFDASNATHVSERVRGLLYILAQHPTYAIR